MATNESSMLLSHIHTNEPITTEAAERANTLAFLANTNVIPYTVKHCEYEYES